MSIIEKGQTHSTELIFFPLFFLIVLGFIGNSFANSGINTTPQYSALHTCAVQASYTCFVAYPNNTNGCDTSVSQNCNITKIGTITFLNPNSPFTQLVQLNVVGFLSSNFVGGETPNIIHSGYTTCIPQVSGVYANQTGININHFQCLGYTSVNSIFFPQTGIPLNATSNNGNNSIWTITGCDLSASNTYPCTLNYGNGIESFNGTTSTMSFYGFYVKNSTTITGTSGCTIYGSVQTCKVLMPWLFSTSTTFTCPNTSHVNGLNINKTSYYCLLPVNNPNTPTTSDVTTALPNAMAFFSFLFGVILLFLGFGLSLTSAFIGFEINPQGTRMAQVLGIALTLGGFIYSEFASVFDSFILGLGAAIFLILYGMFFAGLYWRMFSFD